MRDVMYTAEVGDDVYGEDPTVNRLESISADLLGTQEALFTSSGTQANLLALMTHCERGDEYIAGQQAHTFKYEGGGAAVLGSIQPQPLEFEEDGSLDLNIVAKAIKADDIHFARTRLLCLENTQSGKPLSMDYLKDAANFTTQHQLKLHLDGARLFNAAVKLDVNAHEIASHFDSVSVCLSKGLGAPVGSVLCGNKDQIKEARRWRKVLGGGMRQAGMLAAAGIFALENNVQRLADDHENAVLLASSLADISELSVDHSSVQSNMVFVSLRQENDQLPIFLKNRGIIIPSGSSLRLVTHLNINAVDIGSVVSGFKDFFKKTK